MTSTTSTAMPTTPASCLTGANSALRGCATSTYQPVVAAGATVASQRWPSSSISPGPE